MQVRAAAGLALAAGSGVLYGSINVLAKPLDIHPFLKTAIAYAASVVVLAPFLRGLRIAPADRWRVLTMGLVGGGLAPVLLFFGLRETAASDAGLLLTIEMVATGALAAFFLGERVRGRETVGLLCLLAAAGLVALAAGRTGATTALGAALVAGSALAWGVDNAVSAKLVGSYAPRPLIAAKGLLGASAAGVASLAAGVPLPEPSHAGAMALLGIASIAVSSVLFYTALRLVGAARTSAMNVATTALVGAFGGALLLEEQLTWLHAGAVVAVLAGAFLLGSAPKRS